jgi:hypothetical protein
MVTSCAPVQPLATKTAFGSSTTSVTVSPTPEPTDTPTPTVKPTGTPVQTPTQPTPTYDDLGIKFTTYTDLHAGFSLEFPEGWVTDLPDESIKAAYSAYPAVFFSQQPAAERRDPGAGPDIAMTTVVVFNREPHTFDEAVADFEELMVNNDTTRAILTEEPLKLASGLPAYSWLNEEESDGKSEVILTVINGYRVLLEGKGDLSLFRVLVNTLRPDEE